MRRVLRDMRFLAASLSQRGERAKADRLLVFTERLPTIRLPEGIRQIRGELLHWCLRPSLQDDLSVILTQLRALEYNLER